MKSYECYDCWELERELNKLGWSGDLLKILAPSCNGSLTLFSLNDEDLQEEDWVDPDSDDGREEYEDRKYLVAYINQLDIEKDKDGHIRIHTWW